MSANLDRFACGFTPRVAIEVGNCGACDDMMYEYQRVRCSLCNSNIHDYCQIKCSVCGVKGCADCIPFKDSYGERICENCKQAREELIERVKNSIAIPKYWHTGTEETDDETILEYISADNPKINVHIERKGVGMSDFVGDRQCVTHHSACDCREAYFKQLQAENERLQWHNVKELLPENKGQYCYVYIPSVNTKTTFKGWYHPDKKVWLTTLKSHRGTNKVTHWQAVTLPKP